jgi:phosphate:Na+ symporter
VFKLMQRLHPQSLEEDLSKPRFVYPSGGTEAETGALLVGKEQQRLVGYLRDSLDSIRPEAEPENRPKPDLLNRAGKSVGNEIAAFLSELIDLSPSRETLDRLTRLVTAQRLLDELSDETRELVDHLARTKALESQIGGTITSMVESLHLILTLLEEELQAPDEFQRASLAAMTSDRSEVMDRLRSALIKGERALSKSEQDTLMTVTTHFEHAIWLIRRVLNLVDPHAAG